MPLVSEQHIGEDRSDELWYRSVRLCPEVSTPPNRRELDIPWFTGWKADIQFPNTEYPVVRFDKGYVGQWIYKLNDHDYLYVNLPGNESGLVHVGDLFNVRGGTVQPDISDEELQSLLVNGLKKLLEMRDERKTL